MATLTMSMTSILNKHTFTLGITVLMVICLFVIYNRTQIITTPMMIRYKENQSDVFYKRNKTFDKTSNNTFTIVMYNGRISGLPLHANLNNCSYKNCILTHSKKNAHNQAAVLLFLVYRGCGLTKPPIPRSQRKSGQIWIVNWRESPVNLCSRSMFNSQQWEYMVNWTMSYTLDSDIYFPFGLILNRPTPNKKGSGQFKKKTRMAAWVVSNCHTQSKRGVYVKELQNHGVNVDIYGGCAGKRVSKANIRKTISEKYKFYLAFENSLCQDYITEKFYDYFQLNVIIVVRGGGNYSHLLSPDAYINAADFASAKDLAWFMLKVANDEALFNKYMENKNKYKALSTPLSTTFCSLCEKLNNVDQNRKVYRNIHEHIIGDKCNAPHDIQV